MRNTLGVLFEQRLSHCGNLIPVEVLDAHFLIARGLLEAVCYDFDRKGGL